MEPLFLAVVAALLVDRSPGSIHRRLQRDLGHGLEVWSAAPYVSPRARALTPWEHQVREVALDLKTAEPWSLEVASAAMAALLEGQPRPQLVPIPSSSGSTEANLQLARAIASRLPEARVLDVLGRARAVPSSMLLHRAGRRPPSIEEHAMVLRGLVTGPAWLVDNHVTAGNTLRAAAATLGPEAEPRGLTWSTAILE